MEAIVVRPVREHEWVEVRDLRLWALQDDAAPVAFLDTYADATARPDEFWRQRARGASEAAEEPVRARQFVAVADDGEWIGSVSVLLEREGESDFEGVVIARSAGALVGVYLDPGYRGRGIVQSLIDAAVDWVRERGLGWVHLYVSAQNPRAQRAYEKAGFTLTGTTLEGSIGLELELAREL